MKVDRSCVSTRELGTERRSRTSAAKLSSDAAAAPQKSLLVLFRRQGIGAAQEARIVFSNILDYGEMNRDERTDVGAAKALAISKIALTGDVLRGLIDSLRGCASFSSLIH